MQNNHNHFHSYITPANESAYRGDPNHLLDFPARSERGRALEQERLEKERKANEEWDRFQKTQAENAKALQQSLANTQQFYTPQNTTPSTYSTPQPLSRPQPQVQQPRRNVPPPATPSYRPPSSSSSRSSSPVSARERLGRLLLFSVLTWIMSWFGPVQQNALALLFAACASYQLIRVGFRVVRLVLEDDYNSDGLTARDRFSRLALFAMALGAVVYFFGKQSPGSAVSNIAYFLAICLVYQVAGFSFRVLALINDD